MNKIRKFTALFLLAVFVLAMSVPVKADIIFEPYDDDFYNSHPDCVAEYLPARYVTKEDGVKVYKAPDSKKTVGKLDGNILFNSNVSYTFEDGTVWRYIENFTFEVLDLHNGEFRLLNSEVKGWIKDSDLTRIYDGALFAKDHADEIRDAASEKPDCGEIMAYYYPNGDFEGKVQISPDGMDFRSDRIYTDAYGREWAHVTYYFGWRDFWYCVNAPELTYDELLADAGVSVYPDPGNKEAVINEETESKKAEQFEPETNTETIGMGNGVSRSDVGGVSKADAVSIDDWPEEKKAGAGIVAGAVTGAAAAAGLALFALKKKRKKEK